MALEKSIAALTIHSKKKWHGSKSRSGGRQGGSRGGGQGQKTLCDKYEKFGEYAHYCSSPKTCSWAGNEKVKAWQRLPPPTAYLAT